MNKYLALAAVLLTATLGFTFAQQQNQESEGLSQQKVATDTPAVATEVQEVAVQLPTADVLLRALMDPDGEYAAYAMYTAVIEKYGEVEPYASIRQAELRHINALIRQLEKLGVEVPENPYLETATAPESLELAASAWATGEIDNVAMYDELIASTSDASAKRVLTNLRRASLEMHLPMFELAAQNDGVLTPEQMQGV